LELGEQESVKPQLGKRDREEVDSDADEVTESSSKYEVGEKFCDKEKDGKYDVPLKLFSSHEPVKEKQGKGAKKRRKYQEKEVKELLGREKVKYLNSAYCHNYVLCPWSL